MVSPNGCESQGAAEIKPPSPPRTLVPPSCQSVCFRLQVFGKNCVNSSLKCAKKKRPQPGASPFRDMPRSRQILTKQLALRELERPARLGAAVFLALDHAGVAREEAAPLQDVPQIRLEIGQRLRNARTHGACLP